MATIKDWLTVAKQQIDPLDAELILLATLSEHQSMKDRSYLSAHADDTIPPKQLKKANKLLTRRQQKEPLAYLIGFKEFYGRPFKVNKHVLIPRPESEAIIRLALPLVKTKGITRILEVGAGSGCLAITLAAELLPDKVKILSVDNSLRALLVANSNALRTFGRKPQVDLTFQNSNLTCTVEDLDKYQLVIANLPYVDKTWNFLDRQALNYEPKKALYANDHGLALIKRLIDELKDSDYHKYLILEADPCQHQGIIDYIGQQPEQVDDFALLFQL